MTESQRTLSNMPLLLTCFDLFEVLSGEVPGYAGQHDCSAGETPKPGRNHGAMGDPCYHDKTSVNCVNHFMRTDYASAVAGQHIGIFWRRQGG